MTNLYDVQGPDLRFRARRVGFVLLVVVVVYGTGLMGSGSGALGGLSANLSATGLASTLSHPHSPDSPSPGFFQTHASGNLSINVTPPGGVNGGPSNLSAFANVTFYYWFNVSNYDPSVDQGLVVRVPQTVAIFAIQSGNLEVPAPATTFTVNGTGHSILANGTGSNGSGSVVLVHPVKFNNSASTRVVFSSQLVAVTTDLPWKAVILQFQWNWVFKENGVSEPGQNTASQTVVPDQYATLASTSGTRMSSGQPFTACLSGPVEGRTFSLRAETVNGTRVNDFVQVNATIPLLTTLPYCWSAMIPPSIIAPQSIIVHIWDFQNAYTSNVTTLLLFAIPVKIVNATSSPSHTFLGVPVSLWLSFATVGIVLFAAALIGVAVYRSIRRRRGASGASAPVGDVVPPAGPDPDAQPGASTGAAEGLRGPRNQ